MTTWMIVCSIVTCMLNEVVYMISCMIMSDSMYQYQYQVCYSIYDRCDLAESTAVVMPSPRQGTKTVPGDAW